MTVGPYFDQVHNGQVFTGAPSMTLTPGLAAVHQSILGDRLRLPLDAELSAAVTGLPAPLAHPGLVCDVAIGQSTLATQHVKANLFYRGLTFFRFPAIGDTLFTRTEVVGLKKNSAKPGRPPTGLMALRITTIDQADRLILDFYRCAMLPLSAGADPDSADHDDDLSKIGADLAAPPSAAADWNGEVFRERVTGPHFDAGLAGSVLHSSADVVTSAPELARLTLNIAGVHHDSRLGGRRLVYGGHTIGLALAQASKLLPNLATVLGWQSCDHTAPVCEGDTLYSELHIESAEPAEGGGVLGLRSLVYAFSDPRDEPRQVLDWRFTALQF
ncbi:MAG: MaoC family dehydratase [Mycobacterium sp.]|uniref:MaoC family dehydratase n=1 Tax=Mycobacterium sp. TaxID=1785 RepID=UPI003C745D4A